MMAKLKEYLSTVVILASAIAVATGALAYFAKASELQELRDEVVLTQVRLDQKIVGDQAFITQQQLWALEEKNTKYGSDCTKWPDDRDRKQYKELKAQHEDLVEQKKAMMKKK